MNLVSKHLFVLDSHSNLKSGVKNGNKTQHWSCLSFQMLSSLEIVAGKKSTDRFIVGEGREGGLDRGEGLRYDDGWDNKLLIPPPPPPLDNNPLTPPPPPPTHYQLMVIRCDFSHFFYCFLKVKEERLRESTSFLVDELKYVLDKGQAEDRVFFVSAQAVSCWIFLYWGLQGPIGNNFEQVLKFLLLLCKEKYNTGHRSIFQH